MRTSPLPRWRGSLLTTVFAQRHAAARESTGGGPALGAVPVAGGSADGLPTRCRSDKPRAISAGLAVLAGALIGAGAVVAGDEAKAARSLFNGKDLSGWYVFIPHKDRSIPPQSDPRKVVQVEDGVIHISGEEFGCLITNEEFSDYRLKLEFKWGTKKWPPRDKPQTPRDSGILLHCVGPDKVWPRSIECQIQEHDCGDFYMVGGTTIEVNGKLQKARTIKTSDTEKPSGEWNVVEVVCEGDAITNIVNGTVVNVGKKASVTRGKILLQSEGAEVFYRNITLTPLK